MAKFEFGIDGTNEGAAEGFPVWEGPLPPVGSYGGKLKMAKLGQIKAGSANAGKTLVQLLCEITDEGLKHLATTTEPPALYDARFPDTVVEVATETADRQARWLARTTGLLVGWSAGAAISVAIDLARREPDACVVAIGCDTGARYLSDPHRWEEP